MAATAVILSAAVFAGCGGGTSAPQTGTPAANALVCQHYLAQRAWVKHLTYPTLADAIKFEGYVAADEAQASGKLRRDLAAMLASMQAGRSDYAASVRVYRDCT
jgi:hypothetical protein